MPKQTFFNLPEEKRAHILDIAVEEFSQRGYKQASVSRMVLEAGIAKGSFYQYFEDKDDLFLYVIRDVVGNRKMRAYAEEMPRLEQLTLTEFLRFVFHRMITEFFNEPRVFRIAMDLVSLIQEPIYQKIVDSYQGEINTFFLPYIQHEMDQGELDKAVNPQLLNFMLYSLGQYLSMILTKDVTSLTHELIDQMVDDLDYILTNGIYGKVTGL